MPESTRSSRTPDPHLWITVLAGGVGSRFWPASTARRPKQLLSLAGEEPLVSQTVDRALRLVPGERIRILAGAHLLAPFRAALPGLDADAFMVEPAARGTAPALAWAAHAVLRDDPDAVLVSLHSDHVIRPVEAFVDLVAGAAEVARREDLLLTVGVPPDRPETGFGYVQPGEALPAAAALDVEARRVEAFHEKPDAATARDYVDRGYLWNSGIFVWTARRFLAEVRAHAPGVAAALPHLDRGDVSGFFDAVEPVSVDHAVLERSGRIGVVSATFEWDDVGSWPALARTRPADAAGNVTRGDVTVREGRDNIVYAEGGSVVLWGVEDLVVVRTDDVTLVTGRERAPRLKELVSALPSHLRDPD